MIALGPIAIAVAVACMVLAMRAPSGVERRLRGVHGDARVSHSVVRAVGRLVRRDADGGASTERLAFLKLAGGSAAALVGISIAALTGWGVVAPAALGYAGFILPSLIAERRIARQRHDAERAAVAVVEWLHALVASGRPVEAAIASIALHPSGSAVLDECLDRVRRDYALGVPLHVALARNGAEAGVTPLVELAARVERARELGRGVLGLLQDLRDELRASERARDLEAASHVEGKLTLVLTLCYLPALALLVIVPLFLTLLSGLFGT